MAKLTLTDLASLTNAVSAINTINNNNDAIETALENTLSRDGTSPNQMGANLDMNSNRIINLPEATGNGQPLRYEDLGTIAASEAAAAASAAAAAISEINAADSATESEISNQAAAVSLAAVQAIQDTIDDTYLGAKASDPSVDNDGDPLSTGDWYFNTTSNSVRIYNGTIWFDAVQENALNTSFEPAGNLASTNVQDALEELDTEKVAKAGDTMTGTLAIEPSTEGDKALDIIQATTTYDAGSTEEGPDSFGYTYNRLEIDDDTAGFASDTVHNIYGLGVNLKTKGNAETSRTAIFGQNSLEEATTGSTAGRFYAGGGFVVHAKDDDGGTNGSEKGSIFGSYSAAILDAAATNLFSAVGSEVSVANQGSVKHKIGLAVTDLGPADTVKGYTTDTLISLGSLTGAAKKDTGILYSTLHGQFPVDTTGTLLKATGGSVTKGIDLSGMTFSGNALESPGFSVGASGIVSAPFILLSASGGLLSGSGAGNTYALYAYDVDGATYVPFITLTANNDPACDLADSVTKNGQYIYRAGGTDVPLTDGGTGASDASGARTNLGLVIGTDVQAHDSDLDSIAALSTTAAGRSILEVADPGADRAIVWDDSAGAMKAMALADFTTEASPASGDKFLMYGAEGDLRVVDSDDMPGGGGGSGGMTSIASGSFSGSGTATFSTSIPSTYTYLIVAISGLSTSNSSVNISFQFTVDGGSSWDTTTSNYNTAGLTWSTGTPTAAALNNLFLPSGQVNNSTTYSGYLRIFGYQNGAAAACNFVWDIGNTTRGITGATGFYTGSTTTINGLRLIASAGTFDAGTWVLYGVN